MIESSTTVLKIANMGINTRGGVGEGLGQIHKTCELLKKKIHIYFSL